LLELQGINRLDFDEELAIHAMFSAEDERVELSPLDDGRRINPKDAKGNVEVWLLQVEVRLQCIDISAAHYANTSSLTSLPCHSQSSNVAE
jgi:hypothetical protein